MYKKSKEYAPYKLFAVFIFITEEHEYFHMACYIYFFIHSPISKFSKFFFVSTAYFTPFKSL